MPGNKNSGRKINYDEATRLKVITKSWLLIDEYLNDENVSRKEKIELASKIAVKSMPTELTGDLNANLVAMGTIKVDGKKAEFDIGTRVTEDTEHPSEASTDNPT